MDIFFKDEVLNDFKCETCQEVKEVIIKRKFVKLPRVLILHLKRYQVQEITSTKSVSPVPENQPPADLFDSESSDTTTAFEKKQTVVTSYKMVKNDSPIVIPRYLSLNDLLADSETLKVPKKVDKKLIKLFGCKSTPVRESSYKPPRTIKFLDHQNQKTPLKSLQTNSNNKNSSAYKSSRFENIQTPPRSNMTRPRALGRLDENTYSNKKNDARSNKNLIWRDIEPNHHSDDELPDLEFKDPFDAETRNFDPEDYIKKEMSEEEQLKMALAMSKQEENNIIPFYLDGNFDDENDENSGAKSSSLEQDFFEQAKNKRSQYFYFC